MNGDGGVAEAGGDVQAACSEEAQGRSPSSRACRASCQLMTASGWPVLMLVPAVMTRRKAWRCRKCPWLMISPAAAVSAGMPLAASGAGRPGPDRMAVAFCGSPGKQCR